PSCSRSGCATGLATGAGLVSTVRVTTTERSSTRSDGDCTTTWPLASKSPSKTCLPSADIVFPYPSGESEAIAAVGYRCPQPLGTPRPKSLNPVRGRSPGSRPFFRPPSRELSPVAFGRKISRLQLRGQPRFRPHQGRSEVPLNPLSRAFE